MKILLIHYAYWVTGGPERYLFNLKKQLEENGHTVIPFSMNCKENINSPYSRHFVSPINPDNSWYFTKKFSGFSPLFKQITRLVYSREAKSKIKELITLEKPDIAYVLLFHKKLSPSVITECVANNLPIVMRISDFLFMCPKMTFYRKGHICELCKKNKLYSIRYRCVQNSTISSILWYFADKYHHLTKLYNNVNEYILTNPFMEEKLIEYGYKGNYNLIESFSEDNRTLLKNYHDKVQKKQFCFIGNIFEHKGIDILLKAFSIFVKKNPDYQLVIMGNDYQKIISQFKKHNNNIFKNVKYYKHSNKAKVFDILSNSLCSVVPVKWYENLPNSIIESLSVGTPVIATDIGSLKYMIENGKNGFLFNYGDIEGLSRIMTTVISLGNDKYSDMQKECLLDIKTKYNKNIHLDNLLKVFKKAINRNVTKTI